VDTDLSTPWKRCSPQPLVSVNITPSEWINHSVHLWKVINCIWSTIYTVACCSTWQCPSSSSTEHRNSRPLQKRSKSMKSIHSVFKSIMYKKTKINIYLLYTELFLIYFNDKNIIMYILFLERSDKNLISLVMVLSTYRCTCFTFSSERAGVNMHSYPWNRHMRPL
jgi:hypothetical protein